MSGAEALGVIGLVSSVITIIDKTRDFFDAATTAKGLPEAFRLVATNVPLVLGILKSCRAEQEDVDKEYQRTTDPTHKNALEQSALAVKPIMLECEENAKRLQTIFGQVIPGERATRLERYSKAARAIMPGKKHKVEDLMRCILEKLQLLHTHSFFRSINEEKAETVAEAIEELSEVPPSLPDEDGRYQHSGTGSINVNSGSGSQTNNTFSGTNSKQYNGQTQYFSDDRRGDEV